MTREEIVGWAQDLEERSPQEILALVAEKFAPRIGLATGFGKEGCLLVDLVARHRLPIDLFTIDTGALFPETYALWRELELRYGISIRAIRPSESEKAHLTARLWETDPDRCCELRKVQPLREALKGLDAWVTAIRRDQTPERAGAQVAEWDAKFGLVKVNPLVRLTAADVDFHLRRHEVPSNSLHERGYPSIGCEPCTSPVAPGEDPRAGRWRGLEKTECGLHTRARTSKPDAAAPAGNKPRAPLRHKNGGFVLWFTGLSGAGKSTLSQALEPILSAQRPVEILDGDEVRTYLSKGLGFSKEDRDTNIRRIGYVARLLARSGAAAVTAAISPYESTREEVRALAERDGVPFVVVYVSASIEKLTERDVKGLYRKALAGEIAHFTGVSDPYEAPPSPDVVVHSDSETIEQSLEKILSHLRERGLVASEELQRRAS